MTLANALSKAVQGLAAMAVGSLIVGAFLLWVAVTLSDMLATAAHTIQQASDGVRWEGQP